ncbi:hypothetical protein MTP03_29230 [Tsukamurella sp. PLM1]|nr:hypothetical protein MTP03_29230 [Tsukamurella sp. PLM1]
MKEESLPPPPTIEDLDMRTIATVLVAFAISLGGTAVASAEDEETAAPTATIESGNAPREVGEPTDSGSGPIESGAAAESGGGPIEVAAEPEDADEPRPDPVAEPPEAPDEAEAE